MCQLYLLSIVICMCICIRTAGPLLPSHASPPYITRMRALGPVIPERAFVHARPWCICFFWGGREVKPQLCKE
jgi:hypothetical protein